MDLPVRRMTADMYPLTPLLAASGRTPNAARLLLGVSGRQWGNVTRDGMDWLTADRWAVAFGYHPTEIWSGWLEDALRAQPVRCECCSREVIRKAKGVPGRYCSSRCRQRARQRRRSARRTMTLEGAT